MRKFNLYLLLLFLLSNGLILAQSPNTNYIKTTEYTDETADVNKAIINVQYFDGLGRREQVIQYKASNNNKSLVTKIEYDGFGRQAKDFLPVPMTSSLEFNEPTSINGENYYQSKFGETTWYSEKTFEDSPLNRVLSQAAPGDDWAKDGGHEIEFDYGTNGSKTVRIYTYTKDITNHENGVIDWNEHYKTNSLYKTTTIDENGNKIHEFKDKQGRVVMKRTTDLPKIDFGGEFFNPPTPISGVYDTYYVYDIYGNLVAVIPPLAAYEAQINEDIKNNLCYIYHYDDKNRLIEKKLPGKEWEFMVYDKHNRLIATQDINLRNDNNWLFTKYDRFGRVAYTGIFTDSRTRDSLEEFVDGLQENYETRKSSAQFTQNGLQVYYTKTAFPTQFSEILTVNYYDTYDNHKPDFNSEFTQSALNDVNGNLKGMSLSSHVRIIGTNQWEKNYTVYDEKWRPFGSYKQNHLNGFTKTESELNFVGLPENTVTTHKRNNQGVEVEIIEQFTYDHLLRLTSHTHSVNGGPAQLIASHIYDDLGQLKNKRVGGSENQMRWQSINYKYNIRSWLTDINNVNFGMLGEYELPGVAYDDLFSFKIMYNEIFDGTGNQVSPLYNGNIAQTFWKTGTDNEFRGYDYLYDDLNRLKKADFYVDGNSNYSGAYNETIAYDLNGNITRLSRTTGDAYGNAIDMDNLTYTYDGVSNKLLSVSDAVSSQDTGGFIDGNTNPYLDDYEYDLNGNMILDRNKGITEILYNHLNLPTKVSWSNNKYITYQYNAVGEKVRKYVNHNDSIKSVDYLDGFQYAGNRLQFFPQSEGYVKATHITGYDYEFNYVYNYTDHLGNVRVSYTLDPQAGTLKIVNEDHYYPFGLRHEVYTPQTSLSFRARTGNNNPPGVPTDTPIDLVFVTETEYNYKFNGFEYQDELGLGWYDYQARNYDPALGRWMNVDPLAEMSRKTSPYVYALNNPVFFIDPDGMKATDWYIDANSGKVLGKDGAATNGVRVIYGSDWRDVNRIHNGTISAEATSELQSYSSLVSINETQIASDINAVNNETIADQSKERQGYLTLTIDTSDSLLPTAEVSSIRGADGVDGAATMTEKINGKIPGTNSYLIGGFHSHNESRDPNKENRSGTSEDDEAAAINHRVPVYAIDSYIGESINGNAIHKVDSNGKTSNVGNTNNQNLGKDAIEHYILFTPNN